MVSPSATMPVIGLSLNEARPIWTQVSPPSVDLRMPTASPALRKLLTRPVPAYRVSGSDRSRFYDIPETMAVFAFVTT